MGLKNRLGAFLLFVGFISGFVFFASLFSPDRQVNLLALVLGALLLVLGWRWSRAPLAAPPPAAPPPPSPKPAAPPAPKKPGLLATLLRGPAKKPLPPPPPPPPPPKRGLAALFKSKPKSPQKK
jgi:hypothetical protein